MFGFMKRPKVDKLLKRSGKALNIFHKILSKLERHSAELLQEAENTEQAIQHLNEVKQAALEQHRINNLVMGNIKKIFEENK